MLHFTPCGAIRESIPLQIPNVFLFCSQNLQTILDPQYLEEDS